MSGKTNISWTDATWSPVTGCSKVSPGCAHCYAETVTQRYAGRAGWPAEFLPWTPANAEQNVVLHPERLDAPLHWRKPRRVFVNSMSDLFHERVPWQFVAEVFGVMARTPQHTYQILTKRPAAMRLLMDSPTFVNEVACHAPDLLDGTLFPWPLPNVWLGVSVENQHWADERIPLLLQTPAARHFISAEPLLGPVDLTNISAPTGEQWDVLDRCEAADASHEGATATSLDWVICGGESGPKRREMDLAWVRSLRDQCAAAGVAYFGKQMSGPRPGAPMPGDLGDKEFPT